VGRPQTPAERFRGTGASYSQADASLAPMAESEGYHTDSPSLRWFPMPTKFRIPKEADLAYPTYLAATLSGASLRQLQYWREQHVFAPELKRSSGRVFYSFRDVLALRTFVYLREQQSLQSIRLAIENLRDFGNVDHLASYQLVSDEDRIVWVGDEHMIDLTKQPGHYVAGFMRDVFESFENRQGAKVVNLRNPRKRVSVDPELLGGYPVIAGTRIQFDLVASLVRDGVPPEEVKDFYPSVTAAAAKDAASLAQIVAGYRAGRMPTAA
jgi:uncharacterized protein (DUF433 family)/DNA-binding transcriptional MerR regulator